MNHCLILILVLFVDASVAWVIDGTWKSENDNFTYTIKKICTYKNDQLPVLLKTFLTSGQFGWIEVSNDKGIFYDRSGGYFLDVNKMFVKLMPEVHSKDENSPCAYIKFEGQASRGEFPDTHIPMIISEWNFDNVYKKIKFTKLDNKTPLDELENISDNCKPKFHKGFASYIQAIYSYLIK